MGASTRRGIKRRVPRVYYEDIAGIEGVRWYVVAVLVFVAGAVLSTATLAFLSIGRFVARGVARFAAGMRASHD